jgi:hypothetical protein
LFTGLKLSGIAPTATPETVTLAPVAWLFNLPTAYMKINQTLNATYADNVGQMSFRVTPIDYVTPSSVTPYFLDLGVEFTATPLNSGFSVGSVQVIFGNDSQHSSIGFATGVSLENLTLEALSWGEEASVLLLGNGTGVGCQFSVVASWYLPTANNVTYKRQVDFEVTYFNGTAYKTVVQPFNMTVQAIGYHYLDIESHLAEYPSYPVISVPILVEGVGYLVEYSVPYVILKQGVYNITAAPSSGYYIDSWILVNKSNSVPIQKMSYGNPTTLNITADYTLTLYLLKVPSISPSSVTMDVDDAGG